MGDPVPVAYAELIDEPGQAALDAIEAGHGTAARAILIPGTEPEAQNIFGQ